MKRDMDLVRKILLAMESHEHGFAPQPFSVEGYDDEQVGHHVYLMGEASLINAADATHMQSKSPTAIPRSITWEGHEFLEAARKPAIWDAAKRKLADAGVGCTIELLKHVLIAISKQSLGLALA
jgi:hypothetical protein